VLRELLTKEATHLTLDLLNGKRPPSTDESNPQYSDDGSARPVHLAASVGCAEVVDLLALAGADLNVANNRGQTPVGVAAAKGFLDVVEVLLRHGAGGSDFTRLIAAQQEVGTRKGMRPLSFQATAGGHIGGFSPQARRRYYRLLYFSPLLFVYNLFYLVLMSVCECACACACVYVSAWRVWRVACIRATDKNALNVEANGTAPGHPGRVRASRAHAGRR
jgi:ankyrin repeat protein